MERRKFLALAGAAAIAPALPVPAVDTLEGYAEGAWTCSPVFSGGTGLFTKTGNYVAAKFIVQWSKPEDPNTWEPSPVANAK